MTGLSVSSNTSSWVEKDVKTLSKENCCRTCRAPLPLMTVTVLSPVEAVTTGSVPCFFSVVVCLCLWLRMWLWLWGCVGRRGRCDGVRGDSRYDRTNRKVEKDHKQGRKQRTFVVDRPEADGHLDR